VRKQLNFLKGLRDIFNEGQDAKEKRVGGSIKDRVHRKSFT